MSDKIIYVALILFAIMSVISSCAAFTDKYRAKKGGRRIPEKTLMLLGFFGGAAAQYITMRLIHHKTKHNKFMIGLPVFMLIHTAIIIALIYIAK